MKRFARFFWGTAPPHRCHVQTVPTRLYLWWVCLAMVLGLGLPVSAQDNIKSSIVKIYTTYDKPRYDRPWLMGGQRSRTGSGCILDGHRILTNAHVVSDQTFIQVRRAGQAGKFVATVEAVSHELDLAVLGVQDALFFEGSTPMAVGDLPQIGDKVVVYGFPKGGTRLTVTEGIASRIDRKRYSHSKFFNLVCQIDAAINPGSSGGPVVSDHAIVGVAFQVTPGQNIGYMVPAPVVKHFFKDLQDGRHNGVPGVPLVWQNLENPQIRARYGMTDQQSGILVTEVAPRFLGDALFEPEDIILSIDAFDVANDGSISFRDGERITWNYAVDQKQVGDVVAVEVLRQQKQRQIKVPLATSKALYGHLIPRVRYEVVPSYFIVGGLVFSPLTTNYLLRWNKWSDVPHRLRHYYYETATPDNQDRKQVVVLIDVLPDELNVGYSFLENRVVSHVNGRSIQAMGDLIEAFEEHRGEYHEVRFEDNNQPLFLSTQQTQERGPIILQKYKVQRDRSPDVALSN